MLNIIVNINVFFNLLNNMLIVQLTDDVDLLLFTNRSNSSNLLNLAAAVEPVEKVVGLALPGRAHGVRGVLPPVERPPPAAHAAAAARVRYRHGRAPVPRAVQRAEPRPAVTCRGGPR